MSSKGRQSPPGGGHSQTELFVFLSKKYHFCLLLDHTDIQLFGSLIFGFAFGLCAGGGGFGACCLIVEGFEGWGGFGRCFIGGPAGGGRCIVCCLLGFCMFDCILFGGFGGGGLATRGGGGLEVGGAGILFESTTGFRICWRLLTLVVPWWLYFVFLSRPRVGAVGFARFRSISLSSTLGGLNPANSASPSPSTPEKGSCGERCLRCWWCRPFFFRSRWSLCCVFLRNDRISLLTLERIAKIYH